MGSEMCIRDRNIEGLRAKNSQIELEAQREQLKLQKQRDQISASVIQNAQAGPAIGSWVGGGYPPAPILPLRQVELPPPEAGWVARC